MIEDVLPALLSLTELQILHGPTWIADHTITLPGEMWRDVAQDAIGHRDKILATQYSVSNYGRVKSFKTGKLLSPYAHNKGPKNRGYMPYVIKVKIYDEAQGRYRRVNVKVARLVLFAFVGQPKAKQECLHANDIQADNRLCNLRWGTRKENREDFDRNRQHANIAPSYMQLD